MEFSVNIFILSEVEITKVPINYKCAYEDRSLDVPLHLSTGNKELTDQKEGFLMRYCKLKIK